MTELGRDLRYAVRTLRRSPLFVTVAVLTLGLGIAGVTIAFSLLNGILLRPLPVADPGRVTTLYTSDYSSTQYGASSYPDFLDFRRRLSSFEGITAMMPQPVAVTFGDRPERQFINLVSSDYFTTLGVPLSLGRGFSPEDDAAPGTNAVAVLSHQTWQSRMGGDPAAIGKTLTIAGHQFVVIGVAAEGFSGAIRGLAVDAWIPITMAPVTDPGTDLLESRGARGLILFGRLKPGVTLEAARAEAQLAASAMFGLYPGNWNTLRGVGRAITILSESESRVMPPDARLPAIGVSALLLVVVGLVLLIVCFNLANLLLARATGRRREIAIRLSLGASRGRVIQQLLVESTLLAALGTAFGLWLTVWATGLIGAVRLDLPVPLALDLHPDGRVLLFAVALSMATGLLLGLAPALQSTRPALLPALKDEGSGGMVRSRLRGAFVVAQVGLSLVLLIAAGLFLRSLQNAAAIDPGFEATRGLLLPMDLALTGYSAERGAVFQQTLLERVRALPAVEEASLATTVPLTINGTRQGTFVEGYSAGPGEDLEFGRIIAGPRFFESLGIPLVRGRGFSSTDAAGAPGVAVVNESFARRFWGSGNPLGKRISVNGPEGPFLEIVGVAKDGKYATLGESAHPFFFLPLLQRYDPSVTLIVRTSTPPGTLAAPVRNLIHELDPNLLLGKVTTLEEHIGFSLLPARVAGAVLGGFGTLGLLLATLGIYGVVAYGVSQRTREIGIRIALGAQGGDVVRLVVRDGMRLVAIGLLVGLVIALPLSRLLREWLYGLSPTDPITFLAMPSLFAAVALVASLVPSRRAAQLDPLVALRAE